MRAEQSGPGSLDAVLEGVASGDRNWSGRALRLYATADDEERAELLDRLARHGTAFQGARDALLTIVASHRLAMPAIHRLILHPQAAEDVEQEVLIAIARALPTYRGDARFTTWLHAVARNTAISALRRRRDTAILDDSVIAGPSRFSSAIATSATVRAAVAALPAHYREPLLLRDLERLSYQEVANRLDLNLNTAKTRIRRARALLALSLAPAARGARSGPAGG